MSTNKTQKCQPPVRDTPGPLQRPHSTVLGVGVPDGGLACPKMKKSTVRASSLNCQLSSNKTQKCQPPVRDTPGLLQEPHSTVVSVGVPDGGLACPQIKKSTVRMSSLKCQVPTNKTQKCQPPVRDTPGPLQGPHSKVLGVGVLDGGLARPKKSTEQKKYKNIKTNYYELLLLYCLVSHELIPTGWKTTSSNRLYEGSWLAGEKCGRENYWLNK